MSHLDEQLCQYFSWAVAHQNPILFYFKLSTCKGISNCDYEYLIFVFKY